MQENLTKIHRNKDLQVNKFDNQRLVH